MWWQTLKNDRRVQVAVAVTFIVLALKWLFSDSLLNLAADLNTQPQEGETKTGIAAGAVLPIVLQLIVSVLAGFGAWLLNMGEWMFGKARSVAGEVRTAVGEVQPAPSLDELKSLTMDLGRAALANDLELMEEIRWRLRKPKAIAELAKAYETDDQESIEILKKELDGTLAVKPSPKKRGGTANA